MIWRVNLRKLFPVMLALVLTCTIGSLVRPVAAQAQSYSFSQISVSGNQRIESASIRNFLSIILNQTISAGQVNAAYQRLVATGLFEEVTVTPRGGTLVVVVQEFPTINRINFERNKRIKDDALAAVISSQPRHTYSPAQAEADAAAIVEAYRQSGRLTAEVRPVIIRRADNRVDLAFEIFEGKVIEIQRLSFVGNRSFSDRRLRQALGTKQAGIFRQLVRSDTFIADRVEFDQQILRDFYNSRGFIDFQVLSVATEVARERNGFFLTFKVQEGQSYNFGEITTTSDLIDVDPADYQKLIRVRTGVTYSPSHVETVISRMEELATVRGLNFVRVEPRVTRNDGSRTLDIEFVIVRGERVFIERIDIEGNTTTLDRVIRRQFKSVEGDPFNPRQIRAASSRIEALGFFASTDVSTRPGSSDDRLIVDVDVEDQPTGTLSFGVTYGATSGAGGTINLSESNFLGKGQFVSADISAGIDSGDLGLTFAEPAFLGRDLRLELDAFYRTTVQQASFYDNLKVGFVPKLAFPVSPNGRLELRARLSRDNIFNTSTDSSILITGDGGSESAGSLGFTYGFDNRTSGLNPNAGTLFRFSQDISSTDSSKQFSRTTALVGAQSAIGRGGVVLKAELEGGILHTVGGASRVTDRFFLSKSQLRGFSTNGMGPRDQNAVNLDALGGNAFAVARVEASFPIGLPEEYGIYGGLFMDVGSVWSLDNTAGGDLITAGVVDDGLHLRAVVGISLFWDTPVGPLRFNFSKVIQGQSYDVPENFELTIGTRF